MSAADAAVSARWSVAVLVAVLVASGCGAAPDDVETSSGGTGSSSGGSSSSGSGSSSSSGGSSSSGAGSSSSGGGSSSGSGSSSSGAGSSSSGGGSSSGSGSSSSGGASSSSGGSSSGGPPACTGRWGTLRGRGSARVTIGTAVRSFSYYVPQGLDPNQAAAPLVILPPGVSRGAMMNGPDTIASTGFEPIADREGLVLVAPESSGLPFPWNVGEGATNPGGALNNRTANDQAFIDAVIAYVQNDHCIDAKHMFASGFSVGGGYFANELGCLRKDLAGIAPHSSGTHLLAGCAGTRKPVILFHGSGDTIVDYQATAVRAPGGTRFEWLWRNGCTVSASPVPVRTEAVQGGTCEYYECRAPAPQVALCTFDGMDNLWAGSSAAGIGDPTRESAAELAWRFWKTYAW